LINLNNKNNSSNDSFEDKRNCLSTISHYFENKLDFTAINDLETQLKHDLADCQLFTFIYNNILDKFGLADYFSTIVHLNKQNDINHTNLLINEKVMWEPTVKQDNLKEIKARNLLDANMRVIKDVQKAMADCILINTLNSKLDYENLYNFIDQLVISANIYPSQTFYLSNQLNALENLYLIEKDSKYFLKKDHILNQFLVGDNEEHFKYLDAKYENLFSYAEFLSDKNFSLSNEVLDFISRSSFDNLKFSDKNLKHTSNLNFTIAQAALKLYLSKGDLNSKSKIIKSLKNVIHLNANADQVKLSKKLLQLIDQ
jgi:hypothetical protein